MAGLTRRRRRTRTRGSGGRWWRCPTFWRVRSRCREYWDFSRTPVNIGSTPQVGEHNDDVLAGILGYSEEQIEQSREGRVISE